MGRLGLDPATAAALVPTIQPITTGAGTVLDSITKAIWGDPAEKKREQEAANALKAARTSHLINIQQANLASQIAEQQAILEASQEARRFQSIGLMALGTGAFILTIFMIRAATKKS